MNPESSGEGHSHESRGCHGHGAAPCTCAASLMLTRAALALMWLLRLLPLSVLAAIGNGLGMLLYAFGRAAPPRLPDQPRALHARACTRGTRGAARGATSRRSRGRFSSAPFSGGARPRVSGNWCASRVREHLEAVRGAPVILLVPHFVGLDMGGARLSLEIDAVVDLLQAEERGIRRGCCSAGRRRFRQQTLLSARTACVRRCAP